MSSVRYTMNTKLLDRINPQFIGISTRYFQHKKKRLTVQKMKYSVQLSKNYAEKLNQNLAKSLEKKYKQLKDLQSARGRHLTQLKDKKQFQEKLQKEIEQQKQKNMKSRFMNIKQIQEARQNLRSRNENKRKNLSLTLQNLKEKFKKDMKQDLNHNTMIYQEAKRSESKGTQKVNQFYRRKNKEIMDIYMMKIKDEDEKKKTMKMQVKKIKKDLKRVIKTVEAKKNQIFDVEDEISKYLVESNVFEFEKKSKIQRLNIHNKCDDKGFEHLTEQL